MNKNSIIDYFGYILFKLFGPLIRCLPLGFVLFLGRRLGDLLYSFDLRHKAIAYANIKTAMGGELSPSQLLSLTKKFYRAFGQNIIEIFIIPLVNKDYISKYITFEGSNHIEQGFKIGRGIIFLAIHAGSWELSNIICAYLGFPFTLFVREQRHPRLDKLLNVYRFQKGCKIIPRQNGIRHLIQALKDNQAIGMTVDQGGKRGLSVKFFSKFASMPYGAIKLALKYDATIIPAFYTRINGPKIKVMLGPPFEVIKTGNLKEDIYDNLQRIVYIFQKHILEYPQEYFWSYKIWKYGKEKSILILSDGKTGHLRQAQAVANIADNYLKSRDIKTEVHIVEIKFKNKFAKLALTASACLAGKYHCQGCLWCLRTFLREDVYKAIVSLSPDIVISCGSSVAAINYVVSRENLAKSIVVMQPSALSAKRFDLVTMPKHDNPPKRRNVVITEGALNLIDEKYLKEQSENLLRVTGCGLRVTDFCMGLLIGGDTKKFHLNRDTILEVIKQVKSAAERLNADILVTTSRRTSIEVEKFVREELQGYPRCKLLIIANEKNIPEALGGILGLSQIIITSPESISMISEAASSGKYVLVFKSLGLSNKHQRFLGYFVKKKYIYLTEAGQLNKVVEYINSNRPQVYSLNDRLLVSEAIKRII